jgi:hypothetical protein
LEGLPWGIDTFHPLPPNIIKAVYSRMCDTGCHCNRKIHFFFDNAIARGDAVNWPGPLVHIDAHVQCIHMLKSQVSAGLDILLFPVEHSTGLPTGGNIPWSAMFYKKDLTTPQITI